MSKTRITTIDTLRVGLSELVKKIVDRQYILQPEYEKYGEKGMIHSLEDAKYNLEYLFSAVETQSPTLIIAYNKWANQLFTSLNLPVNTLLNFYTCTIEVLKEYTQQNRLDDDLYNVLEDYILKGAEVLVLDTKPEISFIELEPNPLKEHLKIYSDYVFKGDKIEAVQYFAELANNTEIDIRLIYKYIVQPFQLELGRLWQTRQINVAQEHYATGISQLAMSMLYERIFSTPKNGKVFLGTCTQGELHEFGIRMICDYMESCGWDTIYLGANMPNQSIIQAIKTEQPDVIALSCTMIFNLSKAKQLIDAIKKAGIRTPIIVGGYPFVRDADLWYRIGADGCSADFEEAFNLSEKLAGNMPYEK